MYQFHILTETISVLDFPSFHTVCVMESHEFEVEKVVESHGILNVRKCTNPVLRFYFVGQIIHFKMLKQFKHIVYFYRIKLCVINNE